MTKPAITKKQQEILSLLPRFRFLDRTHIQSFLHHKDEARINSWLRDLTTKQYTKRLYDGSIIGKNRKAAVFCLENNGVRFVKDQGLYDAALLHKLYWDKKRSDTFIEHCLLITTICCELDRKNTDILHYEYASESDYSSTNSPFHFLKSSKLPVDLCFSKKQKGKKMQYFLLTLFDATLPRYRIRKRIRDYYNFYFANEWETNVDSDFPTIFFVCGTKERMIYAKRYAKTLFDDDKPEGLYFNFATDSDVKQYGVTGRTWEKVE